MSLIIRDYAKISHARAESTKALRQELKLQFGISGRRLDNFTLSAMMAVAQVRKSISADKSVALIGVAQYFSIDLMQSLIDQVDQGQEIRPLDFVTTVGNAANYYLAKEFNIHASNLFLGCSESPLMKAFTVAELELTANRTDLAVVVIWQKDDAARNVYAFVVEREHAANDNCTFVSTLADFDSPLNLPVFWGERT